MSHRIRLGPPWEVTTSEGRTRHARKFGRPRTLDPHERVWLVCSALPGPADVSMNGQPIGSVAKAGSPFGADITDLIQPRNEVVVELSTVDPLGEITLEIRAL
jgi:hypothetical protein